MIFRKGQVTVFVILGIIILLGVLMFFLFMKNYRALNDEKIKREAYNGQEFSNYLEYYIKTCMEEYAQQSAYVLIENSFVNVTKERTALSGLRRVPVLTDRNQTNLMSLEESQKYYAFIFDSLMIECLASMEETINSDFNITFAVPRSKVEINEDIVLINLSCPISASNAKQTIEKKGFVYALNYDLSKKYELLSNISAKQLTTPEYFQLGFISEEAYKRNLSIKITYTGGPSKISIIYVEDKIREMEFFIK